MRGYRTDAPVYFGRPGALVTLPWPQGGINKPYERMVSDFVTGAGTHRLSSMAGGSRPFTLSWNALHIDTYRLIEEYWNGANGNGPWCLIDPSQPNLLMPNQAAATGVFNDARGFTPSNDTNHGQVSSNATASRIHRPRGRRSLKWALTGLLSTFPVLLLDPPYSGWFGVPVLAGQPYTFSAYLYAGITGDASIDINCKIQWRDELGAGISEPASVSAATTTTGQYVTCTATAPAGTFYASPRLVIVGTSVTQPADVYVDELLLEQASVRNDWAAGTGVMPLGVVNLTEDIPFDARFREAPSLTLREAVG